MENQTDMNLGTSLTLDYPENTKIIKQGMSNEEFSPDKMVEEIEEINTLYEKSRPSFIETKS